MLSRDGFQFAVIPDRENVTAISSQHSAASARRLGVDTFPLCLRAEAGPKIHSEFYSGTPPRYILCARRIYYGQRPQRPDAHHR